MKVRTRIFLDLCLFFVCFVVSAAIMYKGVYTEQGDNPSGGLVLISEVRPTGGVGRANDEYVELYNPQPGPVIIGGWLISKMTKSASSTDRQQLFSFPAGAILPSHAHVLIAHVDSTVSSTADYLYSGQALSDDNSVVLIDDNGLTVDLVGYGLAKNVESEPADPPNTQLLSIERKPGAELGNAHDTNNNKIDFFRAQSTPQNLSSPLNPLVAVPTMETTTTIELVTSTDILSSTTSNPVVSSTPVVVTSTEIIQSTATTPTTTSGPVVNSNSDVTSTPQYIMGSVLITELYPIPKSGEEEFVELFNRTSESIDLTYWYISDGSGSKTILSGSLSSLTYKIIEKPKGSLNNAGDLLSLYAANDMLIDKVAYGNWNDGEVGNNAPAPETGVSIVRIYGTEDSNSDYNDFGLSVTSTKGLANIYTPFHTEVEEEEEKIEISDVNVSSGIKTTSKKAEPLYARIVHPASAMAGDEVVLDASFSSGGEGIRQFIWEMDDGNILKGERIKHVYKEPDTYSVALTVFDDTGSEKHKTVKIKIIPNPAVETAKKVEETKQATATVAKTSTKKVESVPVFTQISELSKAKTNALVRVRGVLAAVFVAKTVPEFYLVGESSVGGVAVGALVKTKNNTIDARVGDIVEITGKYIVNTTSGNYIQYGTDDQLSVIGGGEILVPINSAIKSVSQLSGGYVQITGEVAEKKSSYIIVSDSTGEIKITGEIGENVKIQDRVIVIGYVVRTKEGAVIRVAGINDVRVREVLTTSTAPNTNETVSNPERPITTLVLIGLIATTLFGLVAKKFWLRKNNLIEATEI